MGRNKIDRTGERSINAFGSEMVIINSCTEFNEKHNRNYTYIDVYFPKYNWTFKNQRYGDFKKGQIKCPYERRYYGIGYLGEGDYKSKENGKDTRVYITWKSMLQRCYSEKYHKKHTTYKDCTVCDEWHNFQNFAKWYEDNYYEIEGQKMHLDKDILCKGNKIYSPETCIYVPQTINGLFIKNNSNRGESVIGTTPSKGKYMTRCQMINPETGMSKSEYLGCYDTQGKAFEVYKYYKERNIKMVADYYKEQIPIKLYNSLYDYEVEITD